METMVIQQRDRETVFLTLIYIGNHAHALLLLDVLHIERSLRVLERPEEFLAWLEAHVVEALLETSLLFLRNLIESWIIANAARMSLSKP